MLSVEEALELISGCAQERPARRIAAGQSLGLVLAEDIITDVDSPPHEKSKVDGYALRAADLTAGAGEFCVLEEVAAGALPTQPIVTGTATRIMTGAPVPVGADSVVMFEQTELLPGEKALGRVRVNDPRLRIGQNITKRGASMRRGDVVLRRGQRLRSIELGLLAEVGRTSILAVPKITVATLSTGNELVPAGQMPAPGQIRNSNGPLLAACVAECDAEVIGLGIGRDVCDELRVLVRHGLEADVLVVSGGVSAGILDLLPGVFVELGVQQVFHKVRVKPGKPLWFGVFEHETGRRMVFGLPGNPVSSYVTFQLFVRPALGHLSGRPDLRLVRTNARLIVEFAHHGDRPTYHPADVRFGPQGVEVRMIDWQDSGDLAGLAQANGLAAIPAGERKYRAGEEIEVLLIGPRPEYATGYASDRTK